MGSNTKQQNPTLKNVTFPQSLNKVLIIQGCISDVCPESSKTKIWQGSCTGDAAKNVSQKGKANILIFTPAINLKQVNVMVVIQKVRFNSL